MNVIVIAGNKVVEKNWLPQSKYTFVLDAEFD